MPANQNQLSKNLKIALDTMEMAVSFFNDHKSKEKIILDQRGKDLKLDLDRQLEVLISKKLHDETGYLVLGEENGQIGLETDSKWIIDPLDGTYNFSRDLLPYCISIGLMTNGKPSLGVIYDFNSKTTVYGEVGFGAYCDKEEIFVSKEKIEQAALCTGFPVGFAKEDLVTWYDLVGKFKKVRMYGSACYSLIQVALGKTDAYFEKGIFLWDVAAGLAIIESAGGKYHIEATEKPFKLNVYAGNLEVFNWSELKK